MLNQTTYRYENTNHLGNSSPRVSLLGGIQTAQDASKAKVQSPPEAWEQDKIMCAQATDYSNSATLYKRLDKSQIVH